jgi:hypothetical protein
VGGEEEVEKEEMGEVDGLDLVETGPEEVPVFLEEEVDREAEVVGAPDVEMKEEEEEAKKVTASNEAGFEEVLAQQEVEEEDESEEECVDEDVVRWKNESKVAE